MKGIEETHRPGAEKAAPVRSGPQGYQYEARVFCRDPDVTAETIYVIGAIYGNRYALDEIEAMARLESRRHAVPRLVFNGDFHWLDIAPPVFSEINRRVLGHVALRGNIETELVNDDEKNCDSAFPDNVATDEVQRSIEIMRRLRRTAGRAAHARASLVDLPMHALAQVGNARIAIVHGDADNLAGWGFSREQLRDPAQVQSLEAAFRTAGVDIFASSHTLQPAVHRTVVDERTRLVINNGAAGMPNFSDLRCGVITRIAITPAPPDLPVLHEVTWSIKGVPVHVAALGVCYEDNEWRLQFEQDWPAGSPAHTSYWNRLIKGPACLVHDVYPRAK